MQPRWRCKHLITGLTKFDPKVKRDLAHHFADVPELTPSLMNVFAAKRRESKLVRRPGSPTLRGHSYGSERTAWDEMSVSIEQLAVPFGDREVGRQDWPGQTSSPLDPLP